MNLRRMIILSVGFHGLMFVALMLASFAWPNKFVRPMIHQVELVQLPQGEVAQPKMEPAPKSKVVKPKPEVERKEPVQPKKEAVVPKTVAKAVKPKAAVKEMPPVKDTFVQEKAPDPEKPRESPPSRELSPDQAAGVPEVMPVLQRRYTEYEFYHALIGREIRKRWAPPPVSLQGQRVKTIVAFSISRSGRINSGVEIERSSGNAFYDQAALRATMGPLPPPPRGYPEELLKMRLIYVLDQSQLR